MAQSISGSTLPVSSKEGHDFWIRHQWLTAAVEEWMAAPSTGPSHSNPMLVFTRMLAHDTVIHLNDTVKGIAWKGADQHLTAVAYGQRAYEAASDMVWWAKTVPQLGCFTACTYLHVPHAPSPRPTKANLALIPQTQAHPFLPGPLARAATFFATDAKTTDTICTRQERDNAVKQLCGALKRLRGVSNLAAKLLDELEARRSHVSSCR